MAYLNYCPEIWTDGLTKPLQSLVRIARAKGVDAVVREEGGLEMRSPRPAEFKRRQKKYHKYII
jgi:hypothetical protein